MWEYLKHDDQLLGICSTLIINIFLSLLYVLVFYLFRKLCVTKDVKHQNIY